MSAPKVEVLDGIRRAAWDCEAEGNTAAANELLNIAAVVAELIDDRKALYRAYVRLLESGRDRIRELGGGCDPVDVMKAGDPVLIRSRELSDRIDGAA